MSTENTRKVHWSFWVIGIVAFIWNVMGSINFIVQILNADIVERYRESERAIIEGRPLWATLGFGFAVFGGAAGSVLLILKKSVAFLLFAASLVGVIVTMIHTLTAGINFSLGEISGIILTPIIIAAFLVWYAKFAEKKGWMN